MSQLIRGIEECYDGIAPKEPWIVGFLYLLTAIGVRVLALLEPLGWLLALAVGVLVAWKAEWDPAERVLAVVAIIGVVVGFGMLVKFSLWWIKWGTAERVLEVVAVPAIGVWVVWFADWDRIGRKLENLLLDPIDHILLGDTVKRILLGVGTAIVLVFVGRLAGWGVVYLWRFAFRLVTGERLNSRRAFELVRWGNTPLP